MSCHTMSSQNAGNWVLFKKCSIRTVHLKQRTSTCVAAHFGWRHAFCMFRFSQEEPCPETHKSEGSALAFHSNTPPSGARNSRSQRDVSTWNPAPQMSSGPFGGPLQTSSQAYPLGNRLHCGVEIPS